MCVRRFRAWLLTGDAVNDSRHPQAEHFRYGIKESPYLARPTGWGLLVGVRGPPLNMWWFSFKVNSMSISVNFVNSVNLSHLQVI